MVNPIDENAFREFERSAHDRIADSYHSFFVPITEHAAEPLLDAAEIGAGLRVLDVATGSGVVAAHAARRNASVTGIDISSRMVSLAAALNPACTFREAGVESLPFPDASFDAVVCAFGIGHFPRPELAMAECTRVLDRNGWLALSWWDTPVRNRLHGVLLEAVQEARATPPADLPAGPPMFRYSEDGEFRNLLASAGLESVTVSAHTFVYRLPSADALWEGAMGSLARTSTLIRAQTPEAQQRIRTTFERLANTYLTSAGLDLPMAFKVCRAKKPAQ
jgi:SAM-dependent methyltransferase